MIYLYAYLGRPVFLDMPSDDFSKNVHSDQNLKQINCTL